jgi:hypothetical protein
MDRFECPATEKTPYVVLDHAHGTLDLRGCSIHENSDRFYLPLIEQVEAYVKAPRPSTSIRFSLTYFNSSSAKFLLDTLRMLDDLHASGASQVSLEWHYEEGDLDMLEAGEDFMGLLDLPVKLVEGA